MQDKELALALLSAESEAQALAHLKVKGVLDDPSRWKALGNMPNNQSVVHAQQSTASAALVEKFTNGLDAILLRHCKAQGIDPRGGMAPQGMCAAVEKYFGDLSSKPWQEIRVIAEENLILYATGSKARPCISIYDNGEGQLGENFPATFCSLIYSNDEGSYKGAVPFVQGRFNMGGTGVLPFCGGSRKMQLIVSRPPSDVVAGSHEWAFTIFCFFPSKQNPGWRYLVGTDGNIMTVGSEPLALIPKAGAKSGEICKPRERKVPSGTLIKMYDYKAPLSNVCGELFKKLGEYLLRPMMPLRIIECREDYKAKVMGVTVFNRLSAWGKDKMELGFEEGASIKIPLSTGEVIPAEIRVFKALESGFEDDHPQTGVRALINGQSHAKRDAQFFRTKAVDKEHIAGSMLVTLDCTDLAQDSRNALFMSNRETFREDPLLIELLKGLQRELKGHEGLEALNLKRYEEKVADAVSDEDGIAALEDLLADDPALANLFGSASPGKVAAKTVSGAPGSTVKDAPKPFVGREFPTYFRRANGATTVEVEIARGDDSRVSFQTDVSNNYFTRAKFAGQCTFTGSVQPTFHLFNGRLTFTFHVDKSAKEGSTFVTEAVISDKCGHGPFKLTISATVVAPKEKVGKDPKKDPKVDTAPSRPDIIEVNKGPDDPPLTIERAPKTKRLKIAINTGSQLLADAKGQRPKEEEAAVQFVFKYGLALVAMSLIEAAKKTAEWEADEVKCRGEIQTHTAGIARVIVPICLTLPSKLPKPKLAKAA